MKAKEIFLGFEKSDINYAVLRNFLDTAPEGDIDILVENKNILRKIIKKLGFEKRSDYGPYVSCRKNGMRLDFRVGYLPYQGLFFESAKTILERKIREKYFFRLGREDEFIHLVLHSIIDKRNFSKHKKRIEELSKKVDVEKTRKIMGKKLGRTGIGIIEMVFQKRYSELLKIRRKLMFKLLDMKGLIYLTRISLMRILVPKIRGMRNLIEKISWIPYGLINRKAKEKVKLNLNKIGVPRTFNVVLMKDDEGLSRQLSNLGFREPLNWKEYYRFVEPSDIVLDIGANIGMFTLLSSNAKKIISVEPLKKCLPLLKKNIENNGLLKKVKIVNSAVGTGKNIFIKIEKQLNQSKIVGEKSENTIEIKSKSLGDLSKSYKPTAIRMDLEGYEYEVLHKKIPKGIKKISLEFHTVLLGKERAKKLLDYFYKEGFEVKTIIEDLPIRLYPIYGILKKTGLIEKFAYTKKNLSKEEVLNLVWKGRAQKFLFLKRD